MTCIFLRSVSFAVMVMGRSELCCGRIPFLWILTNCTSALTLCLKVTGIVVARSSLGVRKVVNQYVVTHGPISKVCDLIFHSNHSPIHSYNNRS